MFDHDCGMKRWVEVQLSDLIVGHNIFVFISRLRVEREVGKRCLNETNYHDYELLLPPASRKALVAQ